MKSIKFTAAILAAFTLCLSAGCSESGSDGAKPQDTAPAAQSAEAPEVPEAETWAQTFIPSKAEQLDITKLPPFELSSDDLHNGVWDTDITNTKIEFRFFIFFAPFSFVLAHSCLGLYKMNQSKHLSRNIAIAIY